MDNINYLEVKQFLNSKEWNEIVKPLIEGMIRGLDSIKDIKTTTVLNSNIEVLGRKYAIKRLESIEVLLNGMVIEGEQLNKEVDDDD